MKISGSDAFGGNELEVTFSRTIERLERGGCSALASDRTYLAPAWIDIQVNGFAGVDYNSPETTQEAIAHSIQAQFATGVSRFFPTIVTGSAERILGCLRNLAQSRSSLPEGLAMEGFHLEGPYISPEDGPRGAHPREFVRPPDLDEFKRFQEAADGHILLVTIAPEWPGAPHFIEELMRQGVVVSIGHTNAGSAEIRNAVSAGASMSTHLGNASLASMPKLSNVIWEQLAEDRLMASFIVDGFHLPPSFLRAAWRAKESSRCLLVTDAAPPAGQAPGIYKLGEIEVELHADGSIRMAGGTRLAGSALSMSDAISNLLQTTDVSLGKAVEAATIHPAVAAHLPGRQRGLAENERADFVRFALRGGRVCIVETWMDGRLVYSAANLAAENFAGHTSASRNRFDG
jgi:N-acetylglucosamine-6-phosphate deacetylase